MYLEYNDQHIFNIAFSSFISVVKLSIALINNNKAIL